MPALSKALMMDHHGMKNEQMFSSKFTQVILETFNTSQKEIEMSFTLTVYFKQVETQRILIHATKITFLLDYHNIFV